MDEWARIYGHSWWRKGTQKLLSSRKALEWLQRSRRRDAETVQLARKLFNTSTAMPPIRHLYTSNDPPNDEEVESIVRSIEERQTCLASHFQTPHERVLSDTASNSRSRLPQIAQLEEQISQLKSLLSPLRRLPPEILQEIFLINAPRYIPSKFSSSDIWQEDFTLPWALTGVCRKWRNVALSTPELWNTLPHLTFDRFNFHDHKFQHAKFDFILGCTGNLPLHVYIEARTAWLPKKCPVLDLLIKHSDRWETVVIKMTSSTFSHLNRIKNRIPQLRGLSLTLWHSWADNSDVDWDIFAVAPRLTDVSFKCRSQVSLRLPKSQLLRYSLESIHVEGIGHALQSASTLQTLCLRSEHMAPLHDTVVLPNLKTLFFQYRHYQVSPTLLDNLILPALEELMVCGDHREILNTSLSLLTKSVDASPSKKSALKSLRISYSTSRVVHENPDTLLSILELTKGIRYLDIPLPSTEVLFRLAKTQQEEVLVPRLACCKFQLLGPLTPTMCSSLNALAASRCEKPAHIVDAEDSHVPLWSYLIIEYWGNEDTRGFLGEVQYDLEVSMSNRTAQHSSISRESSTSSTFDFPGRRTSSRKQAAASNELLSLIWEMLPDKHSPYAASPIVEQQGHKNHVSRRQATLLVSRLKKYPVQNPDIHEVLVSSF
ncbi:hypothetical protein CVT24_005468 [Panaeolus cyanescens]|uniref:Uncharacterized protein n=1 Tax=Panaeolus cyanescens TaxID=181874 RepID=A0A409YC33_9AGAR|nr:hypothetical protein CVT24_005468 [Panaeolus cyanescens]